MIFATDHPMLAFGLPGDTFSWAAFVAGLTVLLLSRTRVFLALRRRVSARVFLCVVALAAALLSVGYFQHYLRGAPRLIDATTYLLQARSLAEGSFTFDIPAPSGAFRGRFLLTEAGNPARLGGLFPPGYPALLSLGVLLGDYRIVGPALAALLVLCTYGLTRTLTGRKRDAEVAAVLSLLSACLRYHCADTMSHGWSALLTVVAVWLAVLLHKSAPLSPGKLSASGGALETRCLQGLLGLCLGALLATRPATGAAVLFALGFSRALCALIPGGAPQETSKTHPVSKILSELFVTGLGTLPGLVLLLAQNRAFTSSVLHSVQLRYYQLADGPADCFGLGLGKGCLYEHGDVVLQQGGEGLNLLWALKNTLHRLHFHSLDVANFEPFALLALYVLYRVRKRRAYWPLLSVLVTLPLGYSFFYFAGSYPGGGARFLSELVPLWHVLLALGLCALGKAPLGVALSLFGFAFHGWFGSQMLLSPHFGPQSRGIAQIPELLEKSEQVARSDEGANAESSVPIVLFSSAHHFNLAALSSPHFLAARYTRDDRARLLSDSTGARSLFLYKEDAQGPGLVPFQPSTLPFEAPLGAPALRSEGTYSLEAEFEYPALSLSGIWVHPEHLAAPCVSAGRALALHTETKNPDAPSRLTLDARGVPAGDYSIQLVVVDAKERCRALTLKDQWLPALLELGPEQLSNHSHIDRLLLTRNHP